MSLSFGQPLILYHSPGYSTGVQMVLFLVMDSTTLGAKIQVDDVGDYILLLDANDKFNNTDYDKCLELLQRLQIKSECQILQHNLAVVGFYNSNCTDYVTLLQKLSDFDLDVARSNNKMPSLSLKNTSNFIARYNKAVIYYHRHMYCTALETLKPLIAHLETMGKKICLLVATLYLQLMLSTNQLNKAVAFLDFLQKELNLPDTRTTSNSSQIDESNNIHDSQKTMECAKSTMRLLHVMTNVLNRKQVKFSDDDNPTLSALKAHQYYIMKDFQMAAKQLLRMNNQRFENSSTSELNTCIANNMGVIHLRVRHYAIAAKFFQNAIAFDKHIVKNLRNASLQTISSARSCEILYNLAISMLHLRRPKDAFHCFLLPMKFYHSNPRLWFRMSEACIMEHEAHEEKWVLLNNISTKSQNIYSSQSSAVPEPTLEFGVLCLRNALTLTQYYKNNFHKLHTNSKNIEKKLINWRKVMDNSFCNPSKPVTIESLDNMLSAIYAAYSFVSLRLGDHVTALEMAQELLKSHSLSDAHKLLGHMYAGEALMMMNKAVDARLHLDPTFVSSLNTFDFETRDWQVKSLDAAQNVVRYNLAVALVLQSEYDTAKTLLTTLTHPIVTTKAMMVRQHIDLKLGFIAPAISLTNNL